MPLCAKCSQPFTCSCSKSSPALLGADSEECPLNKKAAIWVHVVDDRGVIVIANNAWRRFAAERGLSEAQRGEGAIYFDICEHATGMHKGDARTAAAGIRAGRAISGLAEIMDAGLEAAKEAVSRK